MLNKIIAIFGVLLAMAAAVEAKELKVLMIGNSFSICVGKYLPQVVNSGKKHHLILTSAYIGGCSLEKHCKNLLKAETNSGERFSAGSLPGMWSQSAHSSSSCAASKLTICSRRRIFFSVPV